MSALMRIGVCILFGFALPASAAAPVSINAEQFFTQLYEKTCYREAADLSQLKSKFSELEVPILKPSKAQLFLENKPGTVWIIPNVVGDYLVSIDELNNCSVYTRGINILKIEQGFSALLEQSSSRFTLEKVVDETRQTALGPAHFITYQRTNQSENTRQDFSLITTKSPSSEVQAKATVHAEVEL